MYPDKHDPMNMKKWRILNTLNPDFMSKVHMAVVYGDLDNNALIVTNDEMVYTIDTKRCLKNTFDPIEIEELREIGIKTFACTQDHILALTKNGVVYSWGQTTSGYDQNCYGGKEKIPIYSIIPIPNLEDHFVVDISCGTDHSLALTNKGEVYEWNNISESDSYNKFNWVVSPLMNKDVISITCGNKFSMVVTVKREVYGWGENSIGQLGIGECSDGVNIGHKVATLESIAIEKVVCGYAHTLALSVEGVLYVWGNNSYGQLGLGHRNNVHSPVKLEVKGIERVWDVAASYRSHISAVLGEGNRVYIWGQCLRQNITVPTVTLLRCLDDVFSCYAWPRVTYRPLFFYDEKGPNLKSSLNEAFNNAVNSDFVVKIEGKSIYLHKAILKIRCQHFRTTFHKFWAKNSLSIVQLEGFSYGAYKSFFKYLYTDKIDVSSDDELVELLIIANMYFTSQLKKRCTQMLIQKLTVENVAVLYGVSVKCNIEELECCCLSFAFNHMTEVVQVENFKELDKSTLIRFLIKAAEAGVFKT